MASSSSSSALAAHTLSAGGSSSTSGPLKKKSRKASPRNVAINSILDANDNACDFSESFIAAASAAAASTAACVRSTTSAAAAAAAATTDAVNSIGDGGHCSEEDNFCSGALTQYVPQSADPSTTVALLQTINPEMLIQLIEKDLFHLSDIPQNTLIVVHEWSVSTGDWDPYPVLKASFGEHFSVSVPIPSRFLARLEGRELPLSMIYQGTTQFKGNKIHRLEFIDMKLARRLTRQ